jgi:hypothetical protein
VDFEGQWDLDLLFVMKPVAERLIRTEARMQFGVLRAAVGSFFDKDGTIVKAFMQETAEPAAPVAAASPAPRKPGTKPQSRDLSGFLSIMSKMGAQVPALRRKPGEAKPAAPATSPRRHRRRP